MMLGAMWSKTGEAADRFAHRRRAPGVGARLLLAFVGIAIFSLLAAGAGIFAFRVVGERLQGISATLPPTFAALDLSRSAERLIAAAPALLATHDDAERAGIRAMLEAEQTLLQKKIGELGIASSYPQRGEIQMIVTRFVQEFDSLGEVVAARAEVADRLVGMQSELFATDEEIARVLAPWTQVLESEIRSGAGTAGDGPATGAALAALVGMQDAVRATQEHVSAVVGMLAEAASAEHQDRLPVLTFQLRMALAELGEAAADLDPRLRQELEDGLARLSSFAAGADDIAGARAEELRLLQRAQAQVDSARALSDQLRVLIDSLAADARANMDTAVGDALAVQDTSTQVLITLVMLSFVTAGLIVWLYVGRNIAARLKALSVRVGAIAAGDLSTPVEVRGTDEIARVGVVVEALRRNTLERDRLELAGRYKSHLLASASHDLRQPLHALNLFIARLRMADDPSERKRLVENIDSAAAAMTEMFDSLLDMAKLEAGALQPEVGDFPAQQLLHRIEATFGARARMKGLGLTVVESSAWLRSDFVLLERLVFNLVANAVRHTRSGGVIVGLRRHGDSARIDVCDTGPGIAGDQQHLVFREYRQLGPADREGLGLGLAIVERLGALLGHRIELESHIGRGSRFSVTVPLAQSKPQPAVPSALSGETGAERKLVLVIDDDPLAAEATGEILRSWNHDVMCVDSAEAALASVAAGGQQPDLIIADYHLGHGQTGIDAIRSVRRATSKPVAAFLISGETGADWTNRALAEGLRLLSKPVLPMRLRAMVEQSLRESTKKSAAE